MNVSVVHESSIQTAREPGLEAPLAPEISLGRHWAVNDPLELFDPGNGVRSIQAISENTRRAYRADWLSFLKCCRLHGFTPLPTSSSAIEAFIEWCSPAQPKLEKLYKFVRIDAPRSAVSAASLRRAVTAIGRVHRWLHYPDPTTEQSVLDTLKINTANRKVQSQKAPLRWNTLERAFEKMGEDLWSIRDRAMTAVAYSTMFRRSELVALTVEDYVPLPNQSFGRMAVRKTKTDDPTTLKYRHVSPDARTLLDRWIAVSRMTTGPLFRGITPDGRIRDEPLGAGEVARTFKVVAQLGEGPSVGRIGGHSTRIGAAHDLKAAGFDTLDIQLSGGWKSPHMPARYVEEFSSDDGAMAQMSAIRPSTPVKTRGSP